MFGRRILGRLTAFGEPLTIFAISIFDEDMAGRVATIFPGCSQRNYPWSEFEFRLETFWSLDVLCTGRRTSFGEPSAIFVGLKPSMSCVHGRRLLFIVS